MPDTGWIVATGEGSQLADSGNVIYAQDIIAVIEAVTSPRVRLLGSAYPRRAQFAGQAGWGLLVPDRFSTPVLVVTFSFHIAFEAHDGTPLVQANSAAMLADTIWWRLPPGITVALRGFW